MYLNDRIPSGIHTKLNQCFLHSIMQALTYSLLPIKRFIPQNQSCQYLYDTLNHILNSSETSHIDLFWNFLRSQNSALFPPDEDKQQAQDGLETLLYLLEISGLGKKTQIEFQDGDSGNFLILRKPSKAFYIIKSQDLSKNYKYFPEPNNTIQEVVQELQQPDQKVMVYSANYTNFELINDLSQNFSDIFSDIQLTKRQIYIKTLSILDHQGITIWVRLNYQEHEHWRAFCPIQPFEIDINASIRDVYFIFAQQLKCTVKDIRICQTDEITYDNFEQPFIQNIQDLDLVIDIYVKTESNKIQDFYNSFQIEPYRQQLQPDLFKEMLEQELKSYGCSIVKLPKLLILVINRIYKDENHMLKRSNNYIAYPCELQLQDDLKQNKRYKLCSVVNHEGGINDGHYFSYVKKKEQWYCVDNDTVYPVYKSISKQACILFYRRLEKSSN